MTPREALLALQLAVTLHGTDKAVINTAKRCSRLLPRSKRDLMYQVINSGSPQELVIYLVVNVEY